MQVIIQSNKNIQKKLVNLLNKQVLGVLATIYNSPLPDILF